MNEPENTYTEEDTQGVHIWTDHGLVYRYLWNLSAQTPINMIGQYIRDTSSIRKSFHFNVSFNFVLVIYCSNSLSRVMHVSMLIGLLLR